MHVAIRAFFMDVSAEALDGKLAHLLMIFHDADCGQIFSPSKNDMAHPQV